MSSPTQFKNQVLFRILRSGHTFLLGGMKYETQHELQYDYGSVGYLLDLDDRTLIRPKSFNGY